MKPSSIDTLVIGGGPAGLALAAEVRRLGAGRVVVAERESEAGGIPRHSHHTGYGLRDLHRVLDGPTYARRCVELAVDAGAEVLTATSVTDLEASGRGAWLTSPAGRIRVEARAVVLATGCRERPRSARLIPGDRPAGVLTTGMLQQLAAAHPDGVGRHAVIVGAEHVSYSAVLTLAHARCSVEAIVTELPRSSSWFPFPLTTTVPRRIRLRADTRLVAIRGRSRVQAVELQDLRSGRIDTVPCDTVVLTGDWVPDHELARQAQVPIDAGTRGPVVDDLGRTLTTGVFAAGNVAHGAETADRCALEGRSVARAVADWLERGTWPASGVSIAPGPGIAWVSPQRLEQPAGRAPFVSIRPERYRRRARVLVLQGDERRWASRPRELVPGRPAHLPAAAFARVQPGHVVIAVAPESAP